MSADRNASQTYQTQQVMTASPVKLVAMLYDKAISSLKETIKAIEEGNVETRWRTNHRATEIINHLSITLDVERGGEVAENLDRLYSFMLARLAEVNLLNDPEPARAVIDLLQPLRQSWHEIANQIGGSTTPEQAERLVAATKADDATEAAAAPVGGVSVSA